MGNNNINSDGRSHSRLKDYYLAKYSLVSDSDKKGKPVLTHIEDIGKGGACLHTEEFLPVGSILQIYINFPLTNQPIASIAKVVWIKKMKDGNKYKVGIQFLEIEDAFRDAIVKRIYFSKEASMQKKKGWKLWG